MQAARANQADAKATTTAGARASCHCLLLLLLLQGASRATLKTSNASNNCKGNKEQGVAPISCYSKQGAIDASAFVDPSEIPLSRIFFSKTRNPRNGTWTSNLREVLITNLSDFGSYKRFARLRRANDLQIANRKVF